LRGRSAESAIGGAVASSILNGGRSLIGLGLRAAGLSRRGTITALSTLDRERQRESARDVFDASPNPAHPRAATSLDYSSRRRQSMADEDESENEVSLPGEGAGGT
jgi:hypothetical protein